MKLHDSNSLTQKNAELEMLLQCGYSHDAELAKCMFGTKPDCVDSNKKAILEIYAHLGKPQGGQIHKIARDVLKLAYLKNKLQSVNDFQQYTYELWLSESCIKGLGNSWIVTAALSFGIKIVSKPFDGNIGLAKAQEIQGRHFKEINEGSQ